jgi:flagellar basal body-associated protein FliL
MSKKTISASGALHPILFFSIVYVVVLFLSVIICSSLFYSCNSSKASFTEVKQEQPVEQPTYVTSVASVR